MNKQQKVEKTPDTTRFEREIEELYEKYPDVDLDEVPDNVWNKVKEGTSLIAAYEEYIAKDGETKKLAEQVNEKNKTASPGKISGKGKTGYFTAKQVAAMTDAQVRENYTAIMESMSAPGFYDN